MAAKYREKHPDRNLKVIFWPKAALSEEDAQRVTKLIGDCPLVRFDCGHGINAEKPKDFLRCLMS